MEKEKKRQGWGSGGGGLLKEEEEEEEGNKMADKFLGVFLLLTSLRVEITKHRLFFT